ncbi:PepSY-associated TM helix domain-containing protein [Ruegeria sp.]|uniref:PepSY-associated TM helix domain-containing protein n=1 Tax=Ruegeria sp. TaxID=1879320 RepID=UPI003B5AF81B
MGRQFRSLTFTVHKWLGLHLSLFMAFLFLTGSVLVVASELELVFRPNVWTTVQDQERTASFGTIYDTVKSTDSVRAINVIEKYPGAWLTDKVYVATSEGPKVMWTDPTSGAVVDTTQVVGFRSVLRDLHDNLLLDHRVGYLLVSGISILMLGLIVSGLISYRRFWKGFLRRPSDRAGRRGYLGGLHRLLAVWSGVLMLLIAVSSFVFFLGGLGISGKTAAPGPAQERTEVLPADFAGARIDQAEAIARTALPGFEPSVMVPPRNPRGGIVFSGSWDGGPPLLGAARVVIDPVTMEVMAALTPSDNTGIARLKPLIDKLHFGTWGGLFSKLLWLGFGLAGFGVALSGMMTFAARQSGPLSGDAGVMRQVWSGLGLFRWVYALLALGIFAAASYHYAL